MMRIKQKIVLEVQMPCDKCKMKAKKIAALTKGLIYMAIDTDKNQLVIVGVGMDTAILATLMRKKVGPTFIVSVEEVKSEEMNKKEAAAKKKKEEEAKKKKKDEEAAKKMNVPRGYNYFYYNIAPTYNYGYDVRYGVSNYPPTWFPWSQ